MAEGLLHHLGGERFQVHSAGTEARGLRPEAVQIMAELGIDINGQESKTLDRYLGRPFDWMIMVCDEAAEACPVFPGPARHLHWSLADPSRVAGTEAQRVAVFREVRDRLRQLMGEFIQREGG